MGKFARSTLITLPSEPESQAQLCLLEIWRLLNLPLVMGEKALCAAVAGTLEMKLA